MILTEFQDGWQVFFKLLAEAESYPLLFHCSAGRDRTGVGAAMLLELLGVSRELIVRDFLASNTTFPKIPLSPDQLTPIFELIDASGGIEAFMLEVLGLEAQASGQHPAASARSSKRMNCGDFIITAALELEPRSCQQIRLITFRF